MMFRSNGTVSYLPLHESVKELEKWLEYQWGNPIWVTRLVCSWITCKNLKKGGLEVVGVPNSGKSYFMASLADIFMKVAHCRPKKGYTFNFSNCINVQIIVCEEYYHNEKDTDTHETLKDSTSGQPATVQDKGKPAGIIKPTPWLFLSNNNNFREDDDEDNPWPSRLYRLKVMQYNGWNARTLRYRLHPYSWIHLFKKYNLINTII